MKSYWIAKDVRGFVALYSLKPSKDENGLFWGKLTNSGNSEYFSLGKIKVAGIKRGECKRVKLNFTIEK